MNQNHNSGTFKRFPLFELAAGLAVIVIIGINTSLAFRTINTQSENYRRVTNSGQVISTLKDLHLAILNAESGQRGYLLTEEEAYLVPYSTAIDNLGIRIAAVRALDVEIPEQEKSIQILLELTNKKMQMLQSTVNLALHDREKRAINIVMTGDGKQLYTEISGILQNLYSREFDYQARLYSQTVESERDARILFFVFIAVSCGLLIVVLLLLKSSLHSQRTHQRELESKALELEEKVEDRTRELTLYSRQLSRSNQELEEFAFVASHDLQEPLRKIRAFSDRIQKTYHENLDEKGVDYLRRLNTAATRMSSLIDDLLEFSRVKTQGKAFEKVNIDRLVEVVIDDLEIAILNSQATIKTEPLPEISADPTQMHQLFLNILSNAIKFHRPGIPPVIDISYQKAWQKRGEVDIASHQINIKDNGVGFDQQYADKIFIPFQRLHARDEYEGTGIGLAVCRKIVERHGGTISVQSSLGEGTEFIILFPVDGIDLEKDVEELLDESR